MTEQKLLRPAEGVRVRHPDGRVLATEGEKVTMSSYWDRRLASGDVVEVADAAPAAAAKGAGDGRAKANRE